MKAQMAMTLVYFLVFPGMLFTLAAGMLASWVDRKVTARVQWRVGPPLLQPWYDFLKLMGKEIVLPRGGSKLAFLGAPLVGLAGAGLAAGLLAAASVKAGIAFTGDIVVLLYLMVLPSLAIILGGAASRNPLASVGASREMKLLLSYELPFILLMVVPIVKSGGELSLAGLLSWQEANGAFAWRLSGLVALGAAVFCMQAKLALVPFDQAEAETEIMGGSKTSYHFMTFISRFPFICVSPLV